MRLRPRAGACVTNGSWQVERLEWWLGKVDDDDNDMHANQKGIRINLRVNASSTRRTA